MTVLPRMLHTRWSLEMESNEQSFASLPRAEGRFLNGADRGQCPWNIFMSNHLLAPSHPEGYLPFGEAEFIQQQNFFLLSGIHSCRLLSWCAADRLRGEDTRSPRRNNGGQGRGLLVLRTVAFEDQPRQKSLREICDLLRRSRRSRSPGSMRNRITLSREPQ